MTEAGPMHEWTQQLDGGELIGDGRRGVVGSGRGGRKRRPSWFDGVTNREVVTRGLLGGFGLAGILLVLLIVGVNAHKAGPLLVGAIGASLCATLAWLLWPPAEHRRRVAMVAAVAGLSLGVALFPQLPYSRARLGATMDSIVLPASFLAVDEGTAGNFLCFDQCVSVDRSWSFSGSLAVAEAAVLDALDEEGFEIDEVRRSESIQVVVLGHHRVSVRVEIDALVAGDVQVSASLQNGSN